MDGGKGSPILVISDVYIFCMSSMIYPKSGRFGHNLIAATILVYVCSHLDIIMTNALVLSVLFGDLKCVFFPGQRRHQEISLDSS